MAAKFYNSTAAGAGTGADWTNAFTSIVSAMAGIAAGDTLWFGDNSAETSAAPLTITSPGTIDNPCFIYCVDHTIASPGTGDLKTTGTITTTGANALAFNGSADIYGITLSAGTGSVTSGLTIGNTSNVFQRWTNCALKKLGTTAATAITVGSNNSGERGRIELVNTTVQVGAAGDSFSFLSCDFKWSATPSAIQGAATPTTLFTSAANTLFEGVDLSALGSGKTLVAAGLLGQVWFKDCRLGASVAVSAALTELGVNVYVIRSDSAAANSRCEKYNHTGTETTETSIVRTGGATDGTTPQSRKIVTTANSKWVLPFESLPLAIWNDVITPTTRTVTVYGNAASLPNNDDIWLEVEYPGSASSPQGSFTNNTKANNLATGSALTADGSTWAGGTTAFSMSVTFTAQLKGPLTIRVKAAKASSTFYIDPAPVLS